MVSVALGGFSEAVVHVYPEGVQTRVYYRVLSVAEKPSTPPYCPSCRYAARGPTWLALFERGCWEAILAGALVAPQLHEALGLDVFAPLRSPFWRLASTCYPALRALYSHSLNHFDVVYAARRAVARAIEAYSSLRSAARLLRDTVCGDYRGRGIVADPYLGLYTGNPRELAEKHVLLVQSGARRAAYKPWRYRPRRAPRYEYALVLEDGGVEAGPFWRLTLAGREGVQIEACGVRLRVEDGYVSLRLEDYRGGLEAELPVDPDAGSLALRTSSLLLDALLSLVTACNHAATRRRDTHAPAEFREAVHGPMGVWRLEKGGVLVTTPSLYNFYSTSLGAPPYVGLVSTLCEENPRRLASLVTAALYLYTHCGSTEIHVVTGKGSASKKLSAPRVATGV